MLLSVAEVTVVSTNEQGIVALSPKVTSVSDNGGHAVLADILVSSINGFDVLPILLMIFVEVILARVEESTVPLSLLVEAIDGHGVLALTLISTVDRHGVALLLIMVGAECPITCDDRGSV